jgi:hypothetical protein
MACRLELTLKLFEEEARQSTIVLAIGLHPHLITVAHRFHELVRMIDLLHASPTVAFATGSAICDWYRAAEQPTAWHNRHRGLRCRVVACTTPVSQGSQINLLTSIGSECQLPK